MAGTDEIEETTDTDRLEAGSISSTQPEPSSPTESITALGEKILVEIGQHQTNNTLVRWLVHHIARLIQAADHASRTGSADADARADHARTAILQLWQVRSAWNEGWPPPRTLELIRILDQLPAPDEGHALPQTTFARLHNLHYQILGNLVDLAVVSGDDLEQGWLQTYGDRLSPDEVVLLTRAATTQGRLARLSKPYAPERYEDVLAFLDYLTSASEEDLRVEPSEHPLLSLADAYRDTVISILRPAAEEEHLSDATSASDDIE